MIIGIRKGKKEADVDRETGEKERKKDVDRGGQRRERKMVKREMLIEGVEQREKGIRKM